MSLVNIISAIGDTSKVYPLVVRDCGIEIPTKVALTYNQNLKDSEEMAKNATRERLLDEYSTSFVWLAGGPIINKICSWLIKKSGFYPNINSNLFKEKQNQGIKYNIDKFEKLAPNEVNEMKKVLSNKSTYQKLLAGKFALSTIIPISLIGFVIPKLNFALTNKIKESKNNKEVISSKNNNNVSFKGISASLANISDVNRMAVIDGGYTVGRVATGRNKYERLENGFRLSMMMFLNFVAPIWIAKGLDKFSGKVFGTNVNLDPKIFADKEFIELIKSGKLELPKENIIEYLDNNPNSKFTQLCKQFCGVKYLKNGVRDPREYINTEKIGKFQTEIETFISEAKKSNNVDKYAKKALRVKSANIFANIGISSFLLAIALPKLTFVLRKIVTGSEAEPGLNN